MTRLTKKSSATSEDYEDEVPSPLVVPPHAPSWLTRFFFFFSITAYLCPDYMIARIGQMNVDDGAAEPKASQNSRAKKGCMDGGRHTSAHIDRYTA
jgi:hypothetical protein